MFIRLLFVLFFFVSCKEKKENNNDTQRTFCIIKPNAVVSGNVEDIILKIEENNLKIEKSKKIIFTRTAIDFLYYEIKDKPFFKADILPAFEKKPIVILVIKGNDVILKMRKLIGNKNPSQAEKDTIRQLYGKNITENAIHCSDSYENFIREISFFLPEYLKDFAVIKSDEQNTR